MKNPDDRVNPDDRLRPGCYYVRLKAEHAVPS